MTSAAPARTAIDLPEGAKHAPVFRKNSGDVGGRTLFDVFPTRVVEVVVEDEGILTDFDTIGDWVDIAQRAGT